MGQSDSISFGIILLTLILVSSLLFSIYQSTAENLENAEDERDQRMFSYLHTDIEIENVTMDPSQNQIHLLIKNSGSETIYDIIYMDILTNATKEGDCGAYVEDLWIPSSALGTNITDAGCYWDYSWSGDNTINPLFWDPDEVLNITITFSFTLSEKNYYYLINSPNGVSDLTVWNTTIPI